MSGATNDVADAAPAFTAARSWAVVTLLTLIYIFNFVDRQIVSVLAEPMKNDLALTDTQLGLVSGVAFAIFYASVGIPVAWLADRSNRVRIIALSCAIWSLFCAAGGFAQNFLQLALSRIGVGIGEAGGSPPSHSLISDYFRPEQRGQALGIFSLGPAVGPFVASALGGGVAAVYGWRAAFVAVAVPGFLLAVLLLLLVREPARGRFDRQPPTPPAALAATARAFAKDDVRLLTAIATGVAALAGYGMLIWMPAFFMRVQHMTMAQVAVHYSVVMAIVSAAGTVASGWLVDVFGQRRPTAYATVPAAAYLVSIPFFLLAVWVRDWRLSLALFAIPNFLLSMFLAPAIALVQNRTPATERAMASAFVIFMLNVVGLGAGPLLVGAVSDAAQPAWSDESLAIGLTALLPFFLLAGLLYLLTARAISREQARAPARAGA